eukprot:354718-Chlamydomonas_euryale.AAC.5
MSDSLTLSSSDAPDLAGRSLCQVATHHRRWADTAEARAQRAAALTRRLNMPSAHGTATTRKGTRPRCSLPHHAAKKPQP